LSTFNASNESKDVLAINEEEDQDLVPKTAPRPPVNPNNSAISRFSNEDALNSCILPNLPQLPNTGEPGKNPQNKPAEDKVLHHQNEKIDADAIQENKNLAELQKTCEFKAQKIKLALEKSGIAGASRAANILYAAAGGQDVMNDPDPETAADIEFLKKLPAQQRSMYVEALRDSFKQFNPLFQHRMPKYQDAPEALLKWLDGSLGPRE